ncbi:MAG: hypothetical protein HQL93_04155 [Magnetococcales bacterium]|nr:hypothetical protein [Magnetococcales bacterium]
MANTFNPFTGTFDSAPNAVDLSASFQGVYNPSTAYQIGEIVWYAGIMYVCILPATAQTPLTATTYWQQINIGDTVGPDGGVATGEMALFNTATGKLIKGSGNIPTAAGFALLDDVDAAAQRATLGVDVLATKKSNLTATIAPTINDDGVAGYGPGSFWLIASSGVAYTCTSNATGAAQWIHISSTNIAETRSAAINMADNVVQRPELKDWAETVSTTATTGTITLDCTTGNVFTPTAALTGDITIAITNPPSTGISGTVTFIFTQHASSAKTITLPNGGVWATGSAPDFSIVGAVYVLIFKSMNAGTSWVVFSVGGGGLSGPASSVVGNIPVFGDNTGNSLVDSGQSLNNMQVNALFTMIAVDQLGSVQTGMVGSTIDAFDTDSAATKTNLAYYAGYYESNSDEIISGFSPSGAYDGYAFYNASATDMISYGIACTAGATASITKVVVELNGGAPYTGDIYIDFYIGANVTGTVGTDAKPTYTQARDARWTFNAATLGIVAGVQTVSFSGDPVSVTSGDKVLIMMRPDSGSSGMYIRQFTDSTGTYNGCGIYDYGNTERSAVGLEGAITAYTGATGDALLIPATTTSQNAPTDIDVALVHRPIDSVTINTDLTCDVSRDGGTTWTAVTLTDNYNDGTNHYLSGQANVSAQPSGTSIKVRFQTDNDKTQRFYGYGVTYG